MLSRPSPHRIFAPCPCRWTLTMVASTMAYSRSGSSETASNKRCQTSAFTDVGLHPIAKAREDAVPVPERTRQIAPRAAGAHNPQHGFDKQAVVLAAASGIVRLAQTKRL